jgi:hypothetical protein
VALDLALRARSLTAVPSRPGGVVVRDLDLLVPAFKERVLDLVAMMRASGHQPLVWETFRSRERAEALAKRGTGVVDSMHTYGVAVDVICERRKWSAPFTFWRDLRDHAESLGLTSGARWRRRDLPHVQAIPVSHQGVLRQLARTFPGELNEYVATVLEMEKRA